MKLEYAGPRPIISQDGISFKDGKDDKYVYLEFAINILQSMDEDKKNSGNYLHIVDVGKLSDEQMQSIIQKYHPNLQNQMKNEIKYYDEHLKNESELAKQKTTLNNDEKEILIKNLDIMHDYRIQRAKNKIFYHHIIQTIVEIIYEKSIKEVSTPFNEKFWHILQTIEGEISKSKVSRFTKLEVKKDSDLLLAKLKIFI